MYDDVISRQAAIDSICRTVCDNPEICVSPCDEVKILRNMPSAQPTLYGYNIEHLELIARVLQKEDLPPERVVEVLADVGKIVAIVKDEFEEALRKAVEQCMT